MTPAGESQPLFPGLRIERARMRLISGLLLMAAAYYLAARVGLALTPARLPISLLWPPNALLMAALLLTPPRRWWMLLAAVLPAHLAAELQSGVPAAMVLGWYLSNCFEALLGAVAIRVVRPQGVRLDSFSDAIVFLLYGALLAPLLSSFLDALLITQIGWGNSGYWQLVSVRTTSNVLAALIVVPLIVINLVLNACEAMSAGASSRRRLTVQTRASAEGRMLISLYDLGTGFPPGDCEKLFEPFYTTKPNGTGLGLAISRSIISSHGGKLWAEALPKGAAFHVELPAEIAAAAHARRHWPFV